MRVNLTLRTLRDEVREYADMLVEDGFATDEFIDTCLVRNLREIYDVLVNSFQTYFVQSFSFEIPSSPGNNFALPEDFYKLVSVSIAHGTDPIYELSHLNWKEEGIDLHTVADDNKNIRYMIQGGELITNKVPIAGDHFLISYVPQFNVPQHQDETLDWQIPVGWEGYAVFKSVADCLAKEESDPGYWLQKAAEVKQGVIDYAMQRDNPMGKTWTDVYNEEDPEYERWE